MLVFYAVEIFLEFLVEFSMEIGPFVSQGNAPKTCQYIDPTSMNYGVNVT
jgi:hypothetical protein